MKVLVVLAQPPSPEGGAVGRCAIGLLRGLVEHGLDVRALAARQPFSPPGDPPPDLPVEVVAVPAPPAGFGSRLDRLRAPRAELARGVFGARVRQAAAAADIVHLEEVDTASCDERVDVPSLVHLQYLVARDRRPGAPWRPEFREYVAFARAERAAIRRHRHLLASSPRVAEALRERAPRADVHVAPLSLDPGRYRPAPLDGPPTAGIIGTAAWPPTRAAVRRLVDSVWPEVRRRVPGARLLVAGRGTAALQELDARGGVEVVGEVSSAADFLAGLSLLLYPLERGSGMKVKVLEAIACGVPVVTTPAGAEGIEGGDGVVVATEDAALAGAAVSIMADGEERQARGEAARASFLARYAPRPATAPLVALYERMRTSGSATTARTSARRS